MTTDGGSVWDRGPTGEGDEPDGYPPAAHPSDADVAAASEHGSGDDVPRDEVTSEAAVAAGAGVADAVPPLGPSDDGTVWSRGPSIEELAANPPPTPIAPEPSLPPARPMASTRRRVVVHARRPVVLLTGVAAVVLVGVLAWSLGIFDGDDVDPALADGAPVPTMAPLPSTTAAAEAPTATTAPSSTLVVAPATSEATTTLAPSTTSSTTTSTSSSTTTSTTSTSSSTTTSTVPATTVPVATAAGPAVLITGHEGPCKFGSDCLIADFSIVDFDGAQHEFVCEFSDGSRYTFRFDGSGAEDACATSAAEGTIVIEVGGVRSAVLTR